MFWIFKGAIRVYQQVLKTYVSTFRIKDTIIINHQGASKEISSLVKNDGVDKVLIVTDKNIMNLNLLDDIIAGMEKDSIDYHIYSDVVQNPTMQNVYMAKEIYVKHDCSAIIAVGGGSVIDCAKMVGVVALSGKAVKRYDHMIPLIGRMAKLYAVPTTSGTGSEVTISSIITDEAKHKKMAITDAKLAPDYAILDSNLFKGLPKHITAHTGMDALTHAVEAYIGNWKFMVTDEYAIKAVSLIIPNVEKAYLNGNDIEARDAMAIGATYAGYAFRTGGVGYVHGIAHRLSELYSIPHGLANAMVLPHILKKSFNIIYKKLADLSKKAGIFTEGSDKEIAQKFIDLILSLNERMNIPASVKEIKEEDIKLIAWRAIMEANTTYPVADIMSFREMEKLLRQIKYNK